MEKGSTTEYTRSKNRIHLHLQQISAFLEIKCLFKASRYIVTFLRAQNVKFKCFIYFDFIDELVELCLALNHQISLIS